MRRLPTRYFSAREILRWLNCDVCRLMARYFGARRTSRWLNLKCDMYRPVISSPDRYYGSIKFEVRHLPTRYFSALQILRWPKFEACRLLNRYFSARHILRWLKSEVWRLLTRYLAPDGYYGGLNPKCDARCYWDLK